MNCSSIKKKSDFLFTFVDARSEESLGTYGIISISKRCVKISKSFKLTSVAVYIICTQKTQRNKNKKFVHEFWLFEYR